LECNLSNASRETSYKFNGKEQDEETGNYYYGARYYTAELGVWLSVDPLAEKYPSLSPYNFVENNPLLLVDPTGLGPENPGAYAGWMAGNPFGAIADGFRRFFDQVATTFSASAGVKVGQEVKPTPSQGGSTSVDVKQVNEVTYSVGVDGSQMFDYNGQNEISPSQLNPFFAGKKTDSKQVASASTTVSVDGVPVTTTVSNSQSSDGSSSTTATVGVGYSGKTSNASVYVGGRQSTNSSGASSSTVLVGAKAKVSVNTAPKTTTTFEVFAFIAGSLN
jgi:RHS repeat-associated protein